MKDGNIKEILYKLKDSVTNPTIAVYFMGDDEIIDNIECLEPNECKLLLEHITKLQEENKQYKEYIKELNDSLRNYHIKNNKLIYENARLKELDEKYPIEEQLEEALKRKNIYKSIIDKAINEVIKVLQIILEQPSENKLDDLWIINKLEGIQTLLQGEDKDDN